VTFLNEIVVAEGISKTDEILNRLSYKIMNVLNQKGIMMEMHDGMDASVISINLNDMTIQFSGANNSFYLIRDNNLLLFKGDRLSIGYNEVKNDFTSQQSNLLKNDVIYMFTDGYADQFGGKKGSKYKLKPLLNLLMEIHNKSMVAQKNILNHTFEKWEKNFEQVDDVTVFGLRI
jgi:hypothetical protein